MESLFYIFITVASSFILLRYIIRSRKGRRILKERLTREYRQALDGTNRQKALAAGREYYKFFRTDGKLTIYDEQAIDNDMKMMPPEEAPIRVNHANNVVDQLERLAKLKEQGILTDVEFHGQKSKILNP
jgi:ABC-type uncharacterized transport system fused permease/ATPase subunit